MILKPIDQSNEDYFTSNWEKALLNPVGHNAIMDNFVESLEYSRKWILLLLLLLLFYIYF